MSEIKVVWYDPKGKGLWRDIIVLLHIPYTIWFLAYVVIGAALAPVMSWAVLGWTLVAFALAMGISAHIYDELKGHPLKTKIPGAILGVVGGIALAGAVSIGFWQITIGNVSPWLLIALPLGVVFVIGYGSEWPGLHGDWQFAAWWSIFPLLVAFFAQGITWTWALIPASGFVFLYSLAQRVLSKESRFWRRRVKNLTIIADLGVFIPDAKERLLTPLEITLKLMNTAIIILAVGLLLMR